MKRCPTCLQPFAEDALKFCRFDGAPLFFEKALLEAPTTPLPVGERGALRSGDKSSGRVRRRAGSKGSL
jgi:hypothetical protein